MVTPSPDLNHKPRIVSIALLMGGHLIPEVIAEHGDQPVNFESLMQDSLKSFSDLAESRNVDFRMDSYNVFDMEFPSENRIGDYDAIMITGSPWDAYAEVEWIQRLIALTAHVAKEHPRVKIFGVCFGHQIVALALGGTCVNNGRWELGPAKVNLTDLGEKIFGVQSELTLHESHQDHVPFVPQGFHLLGSTNIAMNQAMVSFHGTNYPFSSTSTAATELVGPPLPIVPTEIHILTVQPHPEFTSPILSKLVNEIRKHELISDATREDFEKRNRALGPDNIRADGLVVGRAFWRILGVGM